MKRPAARLQAMPCFSGQQMDKSPDQFVGIVGLLEQRRVPVSRIVATIVAVSRYHDKGNATFLQSGSD